VPRSILRAVVTFNTLLRAAGLDPAAVRLARHQDHRHAGRPSPFALWLAADGRFELYQRLQSRPVFGDATHLASFVVDHADDTLFAGLYSIGPVGRASAGTVDPVSGRDVGGIFLYDLQLHPALADYRGRLVIEWGPGFRSWLQLARRKDKPLLELRRTFAPPPFPGYLDFRSSLGALPALPPAWEAHLRAARGIYLLTDPETGQLYVGAATGISGFWGRWLDYAADGHGGNRLLRSRAPADYSVTILEVASSSATEQEILDLEVRWKTKLRSREFGLNAN